MELGSPEKGFTVDLCSSATWSGPAEVLSISRDLEFEKYLDLQASGVVFLQGPQLAQRAWGERDDL